MKLRNILIAVNDIEASKHYYCELFGLSVLLDQPGNVILTEGLVLQDAAVWKEALGGEIVPESNSCELYFEDTDLEAFAEKLERLYPATKYVNRLTIFDWGQQMIRFYDPDGNLIEVRTPA